MPELFEVEIPSLLEAVNSSTSSLMSPEEYNYWNSRKNRVFFIDYEIDSSYELIELGKSIIQMNIEELYVPKEQLQPIYLFVYSYGGDLEQTYGVIGIIESSRIPIITINMGVSMSAGFLLLLAGHKRYTFKHSTAMVHQGKAGFQGTPDEIKEAQKSYAKQLERMKKYILSRTKISESEFDKKRKNDWYLTDNEQLSRGIVDGIITDISELFKHHNMASYNIIVDQPKYRSQTKKRKKTIHKDINGETDNV